MSKLSVGSGSRVQNEGLACSFLNPVDRKSTLPDTSRRGRALARSVFWFAMAFLLAGAIGAVAQTSILQPAWNQMAPTNSPSARFSPAMAYDAQTGQVVLFGGQQNNTQLLNDTWLWNGTNWAQANPGISPPARSAEAMAYDAATGQVVMFGGYTGGVADGDTWVWNGSNWTEAATSGPSPRYNTTMVYDAATQQVVLFGGTTGGQDSLGDTWVWNGASWTEAATTGPPARAGQGMAYDAALGEVVLFGGYTEGEFANYLNDTWVWNGSWSPVSPAGTPSARWDFGMDYDAATGQVVLFGGNEEGSFYGDTWVFNGNSWSQVSSGGPPGREIQNGLVYDAAQQQMILFGGFPGGFPGDGDTWEYGPPQNFSNVNVCSAGAPAPCSNTLTLTFNVPLSATYGTPVVVTQGKAGLDFQLQQGGTDTCFGALTAGNSCSVSVTFAPTAPGLREGAVNLVNTTGGLVSSTPIYGVGGAPEMVYSPAIQGSTLLNGPSLENVVTVPGYTLTPHALATDAAGDLFIADSNNGLVVKLAANGATSTVGVGLQSPQAIAVDGAGDVFIANTSSGQQEVAEVPAGCTTSDCQIVVYQAAVGAPAPPDPVGLAVDGMGDLFIVDLTIEGIVEIPAGCTTSSCRISIAGGWSDPAGVAIDAAGDLFVTDNILGKVFEMPAGCTVTSCQSTVGSGWSSPHGVAVDAAGDVYVADPGMPTGEVLEVPAGCTSSTCELPLLTGASSYNVAVDAAGQVYVSEPYTSVPQIVKINEAASQVPVESFASTNWGVVSIDSPQSFTLLNVGNQPLTDSQIYSAPFWPLIDLNGNPPDCLNGVILAPGQGCNVSAEFQPEGNGGPYGFTSAIYIFTNTLNGNYVFDHVNLAGSVPANSPPSAYVLTLTESGSGSGSVTDSSQINCSESDGSVSGSCQGTYLIGTPSVTLTATPTAGSTFTGWGGACASNGASSQCTVSVSQNQSVSASFTQPDAAGAANVCQNGSPTPCSSTFPVTFNFTSSTTIKSVKVLTQGYTNLDFQEANDNCTGPSFSSGGSCTVNVTFTPLEVGLRTGAVELLDGSGNLLATQLIFGTGQGAVAAFSPLQTFVRYLGGPYGNCPTTTDPTCPKPVNSIPLNNPMGVAVDAQGNIFMSDTGNSQVLELQGNATNPVGSGFTSPQGLAIDGAGNLYVADPALGQVIEVPLNGTGNTTVYSGVSPTGVAVDGLGDLFIADGGYQSQSNGAVLEIPANGSAQTLVYESEGTLPVGVGVDSVGDVFVTDTSLSAVVEIPVGCDANNNNNCQITIGRGWSTPESVAVDAAGDVYVTDAGLSAVIEVPAGCISLACQITVASGLPSYGVAVDPLGVVSYVANNGLQQVLQQFYGFGFSPTVVSNVSGDSPKSVTLQNVGNQQLTASLNISDPDFTQANLSSAGQCTTTSFSLAVGATCNLSINFEPLTGGSLSGNATFTDNALNNSPNSQSFTLNGTGIPGSGSNFLTVSETGSGTGSVTSGDTLISCSLTGGSTTGVCEAAYSSGTVTLTAAPVAGSTFTGWGGACSGSSPTCVVNMSSAQNVTASFAQGSFGSVNVCTGGNPSGCPGSSQTVTFNFTTSTTVSAVQAVTQGVSGLDFQNGGDNCVGTFSSGQSCTVTVAFFPTAPGLRLGAVQLLNSGVVVATQPVYGIGQGPAISFNPATQVSVNVQGNFTLGANYVAVDAAGDVFISDGRNAQIVEVAANNTTSTIAGVNSPEGLAVDGAGDLYVAEAGTSGEVVQIAPPCTNISCQNVVYNPGGNSSPADVAVDGAGDLFIADVGLHEVVEIPVGGGTQTVVYPSSPNSNSVPGAVAVDAAGDLFVADSGLKTVVELPANGGAQIPFGGGWISPNSVAVDAAGDVYVVDIGLAEAVEVPATCSGTGASSSCMVSLSNLQDFPAASLALDSLGDVFVAEPSQYQVLELQASQSATVSFGEEGEGYPSNYGSSQYDTPLFIQNIGNGSQPLTGSVGPISGANFFEDSGGTTCSTSFTLASGATCVENFYFYPQNAVGTLNASAVATDNTLSANPATQNINLTGFSYGSGVTVNVTGTGSGEVSSSPSLVNCAIVAGVPTGGMAACSPTTSTGFTYSFFETPISGYVFTGWGGACSSYGSNQICNVEITGPTTIIANFAPVTSYTLSVTDVGSGSGTVTDGSQITCTETNGSTTGGSTCSGSYPSGTQVILTAAATSGSTFNGWGGACASAGTSPQCNVQVSSATSATASFQAIAYTAPTTAVNATSAVETATVTFSAAGSLGAISVVTQGATGKDFNFSSGGTCAVGTAYSVGQNCTVSYTFTPLAPGGRNGAVLLTNGSGAVLGTTYLTGIGTGPQGLFDTAPQTVSVSGLATPRGLSVDSNGNLYAFETASGSIDEFPAGTSTTVQLASVTVADNSGATAVDGAGNLYVIQKLNASNDILYELAGGKGPAVQVTSIPAADNNLEIDGAGNLYFSDYGSSTVGAIYEMQAGTSQVTTLIPGGVGRRFIGMAIDAAGNLYAADYYGNTLYEVPAGTTNLQTLVSNDGYLSGPDAVAVDPAGNIYVTNATGSAVIRYEAGTYAATLLPEQGEKGIALDSAGNLYTITSDSTIAGYARTQASPMTFANTAVGTTSNSLQGDIFENDGNAGLVISGYSATPPFGLGGTQNTCATGTLASGASCVVGATFTPITATTVGGTGSFTDNHLNVPGTAQAVSLSGTGVGINYTLTVSDTGSGSGTVTDLSQITCTETNGSTSGTCSGSYGSGTIVTLTATAASGSTFLGWGGACTGTSPSCMVTMSTAQNVTASFSPTSSYTLTVTDVGTGSGTVTDNLSEISCGLAGGSVTGTCSGSYLSPASVTLTANATGNSIFAGWGGDCSGFGASPSCTVTMTSALSVSASFVAPGTSQAGSLKPITAGVVYGQGGSFTSRTGNNSGASASSLFDPDGIALDSKGNLYVADQQNSRVLFYPAGSTTATRVYGQLGNLTGGPANNGGVSANSLNGPYGLALDSSDNLYVADYGNNRVLFYLVGSTTATRVYGQGGSFTTNNANNGGISASSLNLPTAVALDSSNNLYVVDSYNSRVLFYPSGSTTATRVYGQGGSFTTGSADNGGTSANSLAYPTAVALDSSGDLYVADGINSRVLFYPYSSTTATRVYGQGGSFTSNTANNGGVSANSLENPAGLVVDGSGNLYVADSNNNRVLFYPFGSTTATQVYGQGGSFTANTVNNGGVSASSLAQTWALALDSSGNLYVTDLGNNRVLEYGSFGNVNVCPTGQATPTPCNSTITYSYYAAAATNFGVSQVVTQGATGLDFSLASGGTCTGTVSAQNTCTVNVTFAPLAPGLRAGAVELFDNNANPLTTALVYGVGQAPTIAFGPGTQTTLPTGGVVGVSGVAVDAAGDVFVSNAAGAEKTTPSGVQSAVPVSGLSYAYDVAVDGAGDVFLADTGNNRVIEVTPSGVQTTVPATGLSEPTGVAVDGAGDVFITDLNNNRVVKVTPGGVQSTVPTSGVIHPYYPAVDAAGDVFFLDSGNGRVLKVTPGGIQSTVPISGLVSGNGVAVDAAGDVFVSDQIENVVLEVTPGGAQSTVATSGLQIAAGLAVDAAGDVFIADNGQNLVYEVSRSQVPSLSFSITNQGGTSSPQLVSVQNVGNQLLTGSFNLSLGGNFTQNVSQDCSSELPLAPGASCSESFSFSPQTTGFLTGTASFAVNTLNLSASVDYQPINLSGTAGINGQAVIATVPNVIGMTETEATSVINSAGLTLGTVSNGYSNSEPADSVIGESPAAGTTANLGSAVAIRISTGQAPPPAPNPLTFENNYFVTGDFASAGTLVRGASSGGLSSGTITIPDLTTNSSAGQGVPDGADIIDGFLYWTTLESTSAPSGNNGTFLGYAITGQQVGTDTTYTDTTTGLSGTLRVYRADINTYFQSATNGSGTRVGSGSFTVTLPNSGSLTQLPLNLGADLVVIYRILSTAVPLKSVVIYDGSAVPSASTSQLVQGFYDAVGGSGAQAEVAPLNYGSGAWNGSPSPTTLSADASQYTTTLNPGSAYAAVILSTPVANSDNDGILNAWKKGPPAGDFFTGQPGYYDVKTNSWVALPGAKQGEKDLFVQLDYMCATVNSDGTCGTGENLFPSPDPSGNDPLAMVQQAFQQTGIVLHLVIGNAVPETSCTDSPGQLCQFPSTTTLQQPGVIGWKNSLEFSKLWPRNFANCAAGTDCTTRFPYGQKDSYHYVLFGHSLAIPAWTSRYGSLTGITVNGDGTTTIATSDRGTATSSCPSRITIAGVLGDPSLNGVYNTTGCSDSMHMTVATPGVTTPWSYPNNTLPEPVIGITSGKVTSISGYSDLGGADSAVTLALWETAPNQDMSKRAQVVAGTLFHEIGHTLGLSHGGIYYDGTRAGDYTPTFEANCKPNFQSSMNYLFQLDGVGPNAAVAYSNQTLSTVLYPGVDSTAQLVDTDPGYVGNPATFSTSSWYTSTAPSSTVSAATLHCDGTPLTGDTGYRVNGLVAPLTPAWTSGQNITFDGQPYSKLRGYNDAANIDLRQLGATGGEFVSLSSVLSFGSSSTPLSVPAGGSASVGAGGTVSLGSNGTMTLNSGGTVTVGGGAKISAAGTITLNTGGSATVSAGGVVTPGSGGLVTLGGGGTVTLSNTGTITLSSSGTVALGGGGNVTLGAGGGTITLTGIPGSVTIPTTGGAFTIPSTGGTIALGGGGTVTLGGGGTVTLGGGGTIALGGGGNVTLGGGGVVALGAGGTIALGGGGNVTLGGGGNVTLGGGGVIALGGGGTVTLGGGGNVTLGGGGTVTLGGGGNVSVGAGGNVTLGAGGTVALGAGGNVTLGGGGTATLSAGGTIALGGGGTVTLGGGGSVTLSAGGTIGGAPEPAGTYTVTGSQVIAFASGGTVALGGGGTVTLGGGGTITLGGGGTVALGGGGNVTLGGGGVVVLGAGGNIALGGGGNITLGGGGTVALGGGGNVTLGGGGVTTTELNYDTANSVVRPPTAPTYSVQSNTVQVNWTAPAFGVVQTYTISRTVLDSGGNVVDGPTVIGSVSGVNGNAPATTFTDTQPPTPPTGGSLVYTIATTVVPDPTNPAPRSSAPSTPAVLTLNQTIVLNQLPSSASISTSTLPVSATAETNNSPNGLQVSFSAAGPCSIVSGSQSVTPIVNGVGGVSSATVALTSTGSCTITASQTGNSTGAQPGTTAYSAATPVSGTISILPQGSNLQSQTITFAPVGNVQYGSGFSVSATSSSGLPVSFTAPAIGPCAVGAGIGTASVTVTAAGTCTITASAPQGQGTNSKTYSAASVTHSFTISPAVLTVTANNLPATYGQPLPALTSTFGPLVNGDSLATAISGTPALATTATQGSSAGTYPITVSTGTLAAANYSFLFVPGTLTIQQSGTATISISNIPTSAVYGGSFTPTYTYTGIGSPTESVASTTPTVCTVSGGVVSFVGLGPCTLTASATATTDDAAVTGSPQSFTVGQATQTITFTQPTSPVTYGVSPITLSATSTSGLTVTFSLDPSSTGTGTISGSILTVTGAGSLVIDANQAGNTDYVAAVQVQKTIVVSQATTATISISNIPTSAVYNGSFTPTYTYTGVGSPTESTASTTPTVCTVSGGVVSFVGLGSCTLTASATATTDDAAVTGSPQSFTVGQASQTITFTQPTSPVTYGVSPITLSATSTSGLTVTFSLDPSSTGTGSISGSILTVTGAGSLVIDANQAGNTDYVAAVQVQKTIAVNKATATISINNIPTSAVYNGSFTPTYTYTGVGSPTESTASSTPTVCTVSGGVVSFVGLGPCTLTASATATTDDAAVTGSPQSFTVGQAAQTITFTQPTSPVTYGVSPITLSATSTSGLTVTFSLDPSSTGTGTISGNILTVTGAGSLVIDANQAGNTDYVAAVQVQKTIAVNKATATISISNIPTSAVYNGSFTPTYTYTGVGSPTESVASTTPTVCTVSGGVVSFVGLGPCTLTASATATTDDAAVTGSPQSFTVGQASQTITFTQPTSPVTYGVSPITLSATSTSGLTVTFSLDPSSTGTGTISGSILTVTGAGSLVIDANQAGNTDYVAAVQVQKTIVVNKTSQTITFTQPTSPVTYGVSPITLSATSTSGLAVAFSLDPTSTGTGSISGSTLTVTGAGSLVIDANQAGNPDYAAAAQVQKTIVVSQAAQTIKFTTAPPASAAYNSTFTVAATASSGLSVAFTSAGGCTNTATTLTSGAYTSTYTMTSSTVACSVIASQAGNSNYAPVTVTNTVTANGPAITVSPTSIAFGAVTEGSITTKSVTVSNTGNAAATISSPRISLLQAGNSDEFVIVNLCPTSLAAGKSCTITVSFVAGAYYNTAQTATLEVMDNAPGNPQAVALSATVLEPQTITLTNVPSSAVYKSSFTVTATGGSSGNAVTFTSSGSCSNLGLTYTMTSGTGTCSVIANQAGNLTYAPATQVTKTVTATAAAQTITLTNVPSSAVYKSSFTVTASGGSSGNAVTFTSSGSCSNSGSTYTMTSGTATCSVIANQAGNSNYSAAPQVTKTVNATYAAASLSPSSMNFGTVSSGQNSTAQIATLTNTGTTPLIVASIGFTGTNPSNFSQTNTCPSSSSSLAAGAKCTISVIFKSGGKTASANLTVTDNTQAGTQNVSLSGK